MTEDVAWAEQRSVVSATLSTDLEPAFSELVLADANQRVLVASGLGATIARCGAMFLEQDLAVPASSCTPLALRAKTLRNAVVIVVSAEGENGDAFEAARYAVRCGSRLGVLTGAPDSSLLRYAESVGAAVQVLEVPTNGFVPNQWVLAASTLILRLTTPALDIEHFVPPDVQGPFADEVVRRDRLVLLASGWSEVPAGYVEIGCNELGLGCPQLTDPRNLAHGRHVGLSRYEGTTGVIGFASGEAEFAELDRTLSALPSGVASIKALGAATREGLLGSLGWSISLVTQLARLRGIDAMKPPIPDWGRSLYDLGPELPRSDGPSLAATSKAGHLSGKVVDQYQQSYESWLEEFKQVKVGGFVFDYDGTLCDLRNRYEDLEPLIVEKVHRLLSHGLLVGIATGRGDSVREVMLRTFPEFVDQIWVGYHNGSRVQPLLSSLSETGGDEMMSRIGSFLTQHRFLNQHASVRVTNDQVTLRATTSWGRAHLHALARLAIQSEGIDDVQVLRSTHTVDVVPLSNTKLDVVRRLQDEVLPGTVVLAVGDRGDLGGNDFALLCARWSISVEETSPSSDGGWRLTEAVGSRGTADLLSRFVLGPARIAFYAGS